MLSYLIAFGFWLVGLFVGSYGLIQALICVRVGRFITNAMADDNVLQKETVRKIKGKINTTIICLVLGAIVVTALIVIFASSTSIWGYCIGVGFTFLIGVGKTGLNHNHLMEYMSAYSRLMTADDKARVSSYCNSAEVNEILGIEDNDRDSDAVVYEVLAEIDAEMAAENEAQ